MPTGKSQEARALLNLHDLITTVHAHQDLQEVLQATAQGVVDVLGFQVAVINLLDAYGYVEALAVAGDQEACDALRARRMPVDEFLNEFEIADRWGLLRFVPFERLPEGEIHGWVPEIEPLDVPDAWHPLDALYAPLHGPTGELVGVLSVDLPEDRMRPDPLRRQVLEMYAVQAGLAIHHATERGRLQERVRLGKAVRTIVEGASRELSVDTLLQRSFQPLVDGFRSHQLLIRIFDEEQESGGRVLGAGATYPADLLDQIRSGLDSGLDSGAASVTGQVLLEIGERVARDCWRDNRTMVLGDLADSTASLMTESERSGALFMLHALGTESMVIVPLGAGPLCLGYVQFIRKSPVTGWTDAEDDAAMEVGRELGRAVERARLYQRERELVSELQELDRYKGEMISTITHELKNPLTSIRGHVELLADLEVSPLSVDAIGRGVARLEGLVGDLLALAKVRDAHRPFLPAPVDLSELLLEAERSAALQAHNKGLQIDSADVEQRVLAWGERDDLTMLVSNLLGNAVKYSHQGGVALGLTSAGDQVVLTCADTGIGISEADLKTLFDEFDRSSNPEAHREPGTGLGLAIVRRIVDRHGGTIHVESSLGVGTTFTVRLPVPPGAGGTEDTAEGTTGGTTGGTTEVEAVAGATA